MTSLAANESQLSQNISAAPAVDRLFRLKDGRLIGYAEYGAPDGLPTLAFHGTPGSRLMFRLADKPALRAGLRILAPERPGFGLSSFQRRRSLRSWAADMAEFADALGLDRFAVAGVSGGGPYAAACAAFLPQRVLAAALVSPIGPMNGPERPEKIGAAHYLTFRLFPRLPHFYPSLFNLGRLAFLHAPLPLYAFIMSRAAAADWKILSRREVRLNLIEGVREGMRPGARGALTEVRLFSQAWDIPFSAIAAPCFLWQGTSDRNVSPASAFRLGELIPGCRVQRLQGAGHYWIFDHLEDVLKTLSTAARQRSL